MAWLGRRGYGLYAWHWPVLLVIAQVPFLMEPAGMTVLGFVVAAVATVGIAAASYSLLELPFLRRRLRFQVVKNRL
jgi:peptidoglycan/LPS O-acetylase OafA/YrhL